MAAIVDALPLYIEESVGVRLRGSSAFGMGRVEVLHAGEWGTVCYDEWDYLDAYVVCRQLGYSSADQAFRAPKTFDRVWLSDLKCSGTEKSLSQCPHLGWGKHGCSSHYSSNAGVICRGESSESVIQKSKFTFAIRLVGRPYRGLVEVRVNGAWSPICADGWDAKDAKVACGQLGYSNGKANVYAEGQLWNRKSLRKKFARVTLEPLQGLSTNFSCDQSESFLQSCKHPGFGLYTCQEPGFAAVKCALPSPYLKTLKHHTDGDNIVRLKGSPYPWEGRVEVYHERRWHKICDHDWDSKDANVVCRELGYGTAMDVIYGARDYYGQGFSQILLSELQCTGKEENIKQCNHAGYYVHHSCNHLQNAGVKCHAPQMRYLSVRLEGGSEVQGRVEMKVPGLGRWGSICADTWTLGAGMVVCRQLGLGFAKHVSYESRYRYARADVRLMALKCGGWESSLNRCKKGSWQSASTSRCRRGAALLTCGDRISDLIPDFLTVERSLNGTDHEPLNIVHLSELECAFEENCLSSSATPYFQQRYVPNGISQYRKLLRFTMNILNFGTDDFRPVSPSSSWQWHECHSHYHSFENFAQYDILDMQGNEVAEGHKASFCLEDVQCVTGGSKYYRCRAQNQGISVNCIDIYKYDIDCQWIDITDVSHGNYTLKAAINPEYLGAEMDYTNNVVKCSFEYHSDLFSPTIDKLSNVKCHLTG